MHLYFCIVSHGHAELLATTLPHLARKDVLRVCVVDNLGQSQLRELCAELGLVYLEPSALPLGFGANNNKGFSYWAQNGMTDADYFVCCNPDVLISEPMVAELQLALEQHTPQLAGINLFTDEQYQHFDNSIRRFPTFSDYLAKLLRRDVSVALDKATITAPVRSDWAAGSFLIFSVPLFKALNGFDERFFMYFEDVDICLRAQREQGQHLLYLPSVRAVHFAAFRNRKLLSKHFYWYCCSLLRYFWRFYLGRSAVADGAVQ